MTRSVEDTLRWVRDGTKVLLDSIAGLDEDALDASTLLPAWNRRQLVAHLASNGDALMNLVRWAATGVPSPMYASPEDRARAIASGVSMSRSRLTSWLRRSAADLSTAMNGLGEDQWSRQVLTAQGRAVPATEIPWLRAREVFIHAVDLSDGTTFADLPDDFLEALLEDVVAKRGDVPRVEGVLADRAAWLTGRPHDIVHAPELGPWL